MPFSQAQNSRFFVGLFFCVPVSNTAAHYHSLFFRKSFIVSYGAVTGNLTFSIFVCLAEVFWNVKLQKLGHSFKSELTGYLVLRQEHSCKLKKESRPLYTYCFWRTDFHLNGNSFETQFVNENTDGRYVDLTDISLASSFSYY
jgi:hypothetical protein